MVGSSDSIADANTTLNAIVAESFCEAADELEKAADFDSACTKLIHDMMTEHQRIVFNGNGYSDEWVEEAERRGPGRGRRPPSPHGCIPRLPYAAAAPGAHRAPV